MRPSQSVPPPPSLRTRIRRAAGAAVLDNFFRGASRLSKLHPQAKPEKHGLERITNIPYTKSDQEHHLLDVYRPIGTARANGEDREPLPIVLYLHGGGFRILSKDSHWMMALAFARRGCVVFNVNYRLAPKHRFPAAIEDACAAYEWVVKNAAAYGGDVDRIVLAGESAGGNLVASLAIASSYERPEPYARRVWDTGVRPKVAMPACGLHQVTDPSRFLRRWPKLGKFADDRVVEVADAYLGGADHGAAIDLADPLVHFENGETPQRPLPAFFLGCGTADPLIDDTRRLTAALRALGAHAEDRYYEGEPHAFHAAVFTPNAKRFWGHTYKFLDEHL